MSARSGFGVGSVRSGAVRGDDIWCRLRLQRADDGRDLLPQRGRDDHDRQHRPQGWRFALCDRTADSGAMAACPAASRHRINQRVQAALVNFLTAVLPLIGSDGKPVSIVAAQQNRVPEPAGTDFVIITPIRFERLETNVDTTADVRFTGSIAGGILTVSDVSIGLITVGAQVFGSGVAANTFVTAVGSAGGTYNIAPGQNVPAQFMAAGQLADPAGDKGDRAAGLSFSERDHRRRHGADSQHAVPRRVRHHPICQPTAAEQQRGAALSRRPGAAAVHEPEPAVRVALDAWTFTCRSTRW